MNDKKRNEIFMKKSMFIGMLFLAVIHLTAGNPNDPKTFVSGKDVFGTRNFIENKGQYDKNLNGAYQIEAVLDNGQEKIYFTDKGLVYELVKRFPITEEQREAMEYGKEIKIKPSKIYHVSMNWLNANSNISIEKSEKQPHYFTYGEAKYNSYAYKKLTYKNVYPNIDIEYTIPEDKDHGIKYNVIVHPGANVNDIKIAYGGDVNKIKQTEDGNILIKTPLEDITEHAPNTFYENKQSVESTFSLKDGVIGFSLLNGYDKNRTLVIDPWVSTAASLSSNNLAFDVDYDCSGSTYIFGGSIIYKVAKYSPSGILQWTFSGVVITPAWSSAPNGEFEGNFVVNKTDGKTYIGQGLNLNGAQVIRLDAAGNYDNFISLPDPNADFREVWDMCIRASNGDILALGGTPSNSYSAISINPTTGAINLANFQPNIAGGVTEDIVSHAVDDAGNIFVVYAGYPSLNNNICALNAAFNNNLWTQPTTFISLVEPQNKNAYPTYNSWILGNGGSNGFNCLAVNNNFLFYYDGSNLAAYNKTNGALTASIVVPGTTLLQQGGIAVDDCNNIYIGANGSILSYNFNGVLFTPLNSIPLGASSTTASVFDIRLDRFGQLLHVSGHNFVGTYSAIHSLNCSALSSPCFTLLPPQNVAICYGNSATITPVNSSSLTNASYSINPGALTNSTGSFVVSPSITTNYTTFITGTDVFGAIITQTALASVTVNPKPLTALTVTQCPNTLSAFNLGLSFSPPTPTPMYSIGWVPVTPNGITSNTQTSLSGGINPGTYTAVVTAAGGCTNSAIITFVPPTGYQIFSLPNFDTITCLNPSLVITAADTVGYVGPVDFVWSTGSFTSSAQTITVTAPTSTLVTLQAIVNPTNACSSTGTFTIVQNFSLNVNASNTGPYCQGSTGTLSALSAASVCAWTGPNGFSSSIFNPVIPNLTPAASGVYSVLVTLGACTAQATTDLNVGAIPSATIANNGPICEGQTLNLSATNANTHIWAGPNGFNSLLQNPNIINAQVNASGVYSLIAGVSASYTTMANQLGTLTCLSTLTTSALVSPLPVVTIKSATACESFSFDVLASGGSSYNWIGPNNFSSTNQNPIFSNAQINMSGTYTVNVTAANTCSRTAFANVLINPSPQTPSITSNGPVCLNTNLLITANTIPDLSYIWSGPNNYQGFSSSIYVFGGSSTANGVYTLTVKNNNNCKASSFINVQFYSLPSASILAKNKGCGFLCTTFSLQTAATNTLLNWTFDGIRNNSQAITLNKCYTKSGVYNISAQIINGNGCVNAAFSKAYVYPQPIADFTYTPTEPVFEVEDLVSFKDLSQGNDINQWAWYFLSTSNPFSNQQNPTYKYAEVGKYLVTLVVDDKNGCSDSVSKSIVILDDFNIFVPSSFSPNEDNKNELFQPKGTGINKYDLSIYDRWGEEVFHTTNFLTGWDGTYKGQLCKSDVYVWKIKATSYTQKTKQLIGHVMLTR
jgi:gliding motility-associated-like protein